LLFGVRRLIQAVVVAGLAVVPVACSPIYTASCQNTLVTSTAGPITDPALKELSGIHVGVRNPATWWVHNDSGDTARVFALDGTAAVRAPTPSPASPPSTGRTSRSCRVPRPAPV
jgi:hypothetical protein